MNISKEAQITEWFAKQSKLDERRFPIGIGDDMAQMRLGDADSVLITTDMLLDGSHFVYAEAGAERVGYKAMACNLSDCAAMASVPLCAVCSVALPRGFASDELKRIHGGILRAGNMFDCALVGGDITSWEGKLAISITMLSKPGVSEPVKRSTARAGDIICVTGTLGGSGAGRHLEFVPRVREALALASIARINSMMDISDGLSTDLNHLCRLSGVGAKIEANKLPVSEAAKASGDAVGAALNDGEDFELLFTVRPGNFETIRNNWKFDVGITAVGEITDGREVLIKRDGQVKVLEAGGFDHLGH
jgi:thiamine-monophosphate kinase